MLEVPPPDSRAVILCFSKDGSERKTHKVDASGTEWEAIAFDPDDLILAAEAEISRAFADDS
jgi:hypothetical protein